MTLTNAIRTAASSLASQSQHIANLGRNISGVGDPTYVRRESTVYTALNSTTRVETQRYVDQSAYRSTLSAESGAARAQSFANGVNQIAAMQGLDDFAFSPASMLEKLKQSVEFAAASASDPSALNSMLEEARTTASTLNASYSELLLARARADQQIVASVSTINDTLADLKSINDEIVTGTIVGRDVFDQMDIRDQLVNRLSEEIGINVLPAENNDIIITTTGGALLFENSPRSVTFQPTSVFGAATSGSSLQVDGVVVSGDDATFQIRSGKIAGYLDLRDNFLVRQQDQLDEVARGLISVFSEADQAGGTKPNLVGLFSWDGGAGLPASGVLEPGIAASIKINPAVDTAQGGDITLVRDGVVNGDADYLYNAEGGNAFSDRLYEIAAAFDQNQTFDASTGISTDQSLLDFARSSLDDLHSQRSQAQISSEYKTALATEFRQTFQSETGANLDFEMSRLLEVERAYQASARLLQTVDEMLANLLDAVR